MTLMLPARPLLAATVILLGLGCDAWVTRERPLVYAPWEEGLTLVFANPSQPSTPKLQVRVKHSDLTSDGRKVVVTYGTLAGETELAFHQRDGGVAFQVDAQKEVMVLPPGFPDRVSRWEDKGFFMSVVGRAKVDLPGVKLPDPEAIGVWVEAVPMVPGGVTRRTLLVPDYGEVATLNLINGQWVTVNRLVSQGFSDPPSLGSAR